MQAMNSIISDFTRLDFLENQSALPKVRSFKDEERERGKVVTHCEIYE